MKIMIIEYDLNVINNITKAIKNIDKKKKVDKICTFDNGQEAIEAFLEEDFDVIVFELFLPIKDGIDILNTVNLIKCKKRPLLIGLSSTKSETVTNRCIELGIDYLFFKPINIQSIYRRVEYLISNFNNLMENEEKHINTNRENFIKDNLNQFNFKLNTLGYKYLTDSISFCIEDKGLIDNVTKGLYFMVAKKYETSNMNVERAIRHLIKSQYKRNNKPFASIGFESICPSNSQFISYMVYYIERPITNVNKEIE